MWTMEEIITRFVDALNHLLEDRPKKRKHLKLVSFRPNPEVKKIGEIGEEGYVFKLKIASGVQFPLVAVPSEQARQEFVASCRTANCFVPALVPIFEEETPSLAHRIKQLIRRMVRTTKHVVRCMRRRHPGRFSRRHCQAAAQRAVIPAVSI